MESQVNWGSLPKEARGLVWLKTLGKNTGEVAEEIGMSPSYLSRVLTGKRSPKHVIALLMEYGAPAEIFEEGEDGSDNAA